jgi:hypothetical protein
MKNLFVITALTFVLAACGSDEFPQPDPSQPIEIVDCNPDEICQ